MLDSDELKVEDENIVLSYIYHYSRQVRDRESLSAAVHAVNHLSKCLRFNFLSLYNITSAIRKSEAVQLSKVFIDMMTQEYKYRLKMGKLDTSNMSFTQNQEDAQVHFNEKQRKFYN